MIAGFTAMGLVLVAAIGATLWEVSHISMESDQIANLRVPTAADSARMVNNINASLATLRGWMLTGNESFKVDRASVWDDIDRTADELDHYSASWTDPANVERWTEMKPTPPQDGVSGLTSICTPQDPMKVDGDRDCPSIGRTFA